MCRSDQFPARVGMGGAGVQTGWQAHPWGQEEAQQEEQRVSVLWSPQGQLCWVPGLI